MLQRIRNLSIRTCLSSIVSIVLGATALMMVLPSTMVQPFYVTGICIGCAFIVSLDSFRQYVNENTPLVFTRVTTTLTILGFLALGFGFVPPP